MLGYAKLSAVLHFLISLHSVHFSAARFPFRSKQRCKGFALTAFVDCRLRVAHEAVTARVLLGRSTFCTAKHEYMRDKNRPRRHLTHHACVSGTSIVKFGEYTLQTPASSTPDTETHFRFFSTFMYVLRTLATTLVVSGRHSCCCNLLILVRIIPSWYGKLLSAPVPGRSRTLTHHKQYWRCSSTNICGRLWG